jgi:CRISPR/Cas system-associated exonuclease Cas4 (RecB family)
MRTIRASEIGTYLYCKRAWWYRRKGVESQNQPEMAQGTIIHRQHSRSVFAAGCLRSMAYVILLAGLILVVIYLTGKIV